MEKIMKRMLLILYLLVFVAGCTRYYQVTNPETGHDYYTKNVDHKGSGAVKITDEKTGATVVLQSSEVRKISKTEFDQGLYAN